MKKLAFFILLSLVTLGVSAQSNLKWNVNAGIGMSNWYGDDTDGTDAKFAYKVGIGLEVPFANTNVWSFQTGLNFISKGVKGNGVTDAWDVVDVTINQLYLELPLMVGARIHTASNFDLLFKGGPSFEIYKLGTILLNRKSKKNKALYTNIQYITNTHLVNPI